MVHNIVHAGKIIATIIRSGFQKPGIHFFTPDNFSQQVAYMNHPAGKVIDPHVHNLVQREVFYTQEVLLLRRGRLRVDFYGDDSGYLESCIMEEGDLVLLASGGHGFEALEEIEMIEVKQGPYAGEGDKTRFAGISAHEVRMGTSNG